MFAIAVDIGGSHVRCGLIQDRKLLAAEGFRVEQPSLAAILPTLNSTIRPLIEQGRKLGAEFLGIAVGLCAVVSSDDAVVAANGKYDDAISFSFSDWARDEFGMACAVENDTRLALAGEHFAGLARGYSDAVLITLGTGIGGAAMLGNKLLYSHGARAGALAGHLGVDWNGRLCSCGNRGCAEAEASTAALHAICSETSGFDDSALAHVNGTINFESLFRAADEGDDCAQRVLERCVAVWSALSVSLLHAYDPQILIFGGGVMSRQEVILPAIRNHVYRHAWTGERSLQIVASTLGDDAALLGAIPFLEDRLQQRGARQ